MIGQYGTASRQLIAFGMLNLAAIMAVTILASKPSNTTTVLVAKHNVQAGSIIADGTSYEQFQEVIILADEYTDTSKFIHNREELVKKIGGAGHTGSILKTMKEGDYMLDTNIAE